MNTATQVTQNLDKPSLQAAFNSLTPEHQARVRRVFGECQDIEARDVQRKFHIMANLRWPKTKTALLDELNKGKLGHYDAPTLDRLLAELEISDEIEVKHNHVIRRNM